MIYITCPTCGYFIGSKTVEFEEKKQKICDNVKYTQEEKEVEIQKLIKNIGLRRYCCRMRLMTAKDIVQDILPVSNETI